MTKNQFVKRLTARLSLGSAHMFKADQVEEIVVALFDEIKEIVREGDELHLNNFGRFYPKQMQSRVVRGGWYQQDQKEYVVPEKTKIGFSSFPTVDKYVSERPKRQRVLNESLFEDY